MGEFGNRRDRDGECKRVVMLGLTGVEMRRRCGLGPVALRPWKVRPRRDLAWRARGPDFPGGTGPWKGKELVAGKEGRPECGR